jgi:peroxiredoxin
MKSQSLQKIFVISILGIFFLAGSCTAQKESAESPGNAKKTQPEAVDTSSTGRSEGDDPQYQPAIDFALMSISDNKVSLTDFLGHKIVLMNFWATWCPYCITEIPHLNKIETSLADQVKLLSIDILEKPEKVKGFASKKGIKFDVLLDRQGEVARKYRVRGTPTSIVIDKQGNIVYYGYELNKAEQVIMSLLQKG